MVTQALAVTFSFVSTVEIAQLNRLAICKLVVLRHDENLIVLAQ